MTKEQAETAITASALIVGGIYGYRKLIEPAIGTQPSQGTVKDIAGLGQIPPIGRFVTGWGVTFLILSLLAQVSPGLGGSLAILVTTGDVLTNGQALAKDIQHGLGNSGELPALPANAGGVPVYDPSKESKQSYDQRFGQYLLTHPRPTQQASPNPLIPGNSLGGSPFPTTSG